MISWVAIALFLAAVAAVALAVNRRGARAYGIVIVVVGAAVIFVWQARRRHDQHRAPMPTNDAVATSQANRRQLSTMRGTARDAPRILRATEPRPSRQDAPRAPEPDDDESASPSLQHVDTDRAAIEESPNTITPPVEPPTWLNLAAGKQPDGRFLAVVTAQGWDIERSWREIRQRQITWSVRSYAMSEIGGHWPVQALDGQTTESLIVDSYVESRHVYTGRSGPRARHKLYVLLDFPPSLREALLVRRAADLVESRLLYASLAAVLAIGLLAVVFAYLKADDATDGRYTGRLQVGAGLLLVGAAVAVVALTAFAISEESHVGGLLSII